MNTTFWSLLNNEFRKKPIDNMMKTTEHRWICPNTVPSIDERFGPTHISQHKLIWQNMEYVSIDDVEPGAF